MKISALRRMIETATMRGAGSDPAAAFAEVERIIEAEYSHDEKRTAIYNALRATRPEGVYVYRYVEAVYDTWCVYEESQGGIDKLFKCDYTIDADGAATLGAPQEVRAEVSYVPVASTAPAVESQLRIRESFIELRERAIADDGTMLIRVIAPGWGSSGYYSEAMLKRDIPTIFPRGTHMYADHPTYTETMERPERSIKDLAATFVETPYWLSEGHAGPGMYVRVKPFADYKAMLEDKAEAIGDSIFALGTHHIGEAEGRTGVIVDSLVAGDSVDFVTKAGAGGAIITLQESARLKREAAPADPQPQDNPQEDITVTQEEILALQGQVATLTEANSKLVSDNEAMRAAALKREAVAHVATHLATEKYKELPSGAKAKVEAAVLLPAPAAKEDGSLDVEQLTSAIEAAVKVEVEYIANLTESGTVRGLGAGGGINLAESANLSGVYAARGALGL